MLTCLLCDIVCNTVHVYLLLFTVFASVCHFTFILKLQQNFLTHLTVFSSQNKDDLRLDSTKS